ncbi:MAG: ribonuclease HII [Clostridia bacterium]|nr:ribonuclease HII [Clostridia bacterium]
MDFQFDEKTAQGLGYRLICGIDEAGRGPLAGPVYAAAVILPAGIVIEGLDDSKKVPPKKREQLFEVICGEALAYSIACADESEIDRINILQATFVAMRRAAEGLTLHPQAAFVDGSLDPSLGIPALCIVKGDSKSPSIAAASILAKVSRDRFMEGLDEKYPQYGFAQHKGYPTKLHYERLAQYGVSPVHRRSFLKKLGVPQE